MSGVFGDTALLSASAYDTWSDQYDSCANPTRDLDTKALEAQNLDLSGKDVLEVGCGTGRHSERLLKGADGVKSYLAFDVSTGMIDRAKARISNSAEIPSESKSKVSFVLHDVTLPWPCPSQSVDILFEDLALEHLESVDFFFKEAARVLRPGGVLFISEFHPYKQYQGKKASLITNGEVLSAPPCFTHHTSEFVNGGISNGFKLVCLQDWHDDEGDAPPRVLSIRFVKE